MCSFDFEENDSMRDISVDELKSIELEMLKFIDEVCKKEQFHALRLFLFLKIRWIRTNLFHAKIFRERRHRILID